MKKLEGIPFSEYRLIELIIALPLGLLSYLLFRALRLTVTEEVDGKASKLPTNAILCCFHIDQIIGGVCDDFWNKASKEFPVHFLGFHGLISYLGSSVWPYQIKINAFRYHMRGGVDRYTQVRQFLKKNENGKFVIGTDSGGPYGKIRESAIRLSIHTGRPVVGVRHAATRFITINSHKIPFPFTTVTTRITTIFDPNQTEVFETARVMERLQFEMDTL